MDVFFISQNKNFGSMPAVSRVYLKFFYKIFCHVHGFVHGGVLQL